MKKKIGLFAGTFDPPTLGHLDIIQRAAKFCDVLHIGIAVNSSKKTPVFPCFERKAMLAEVCHDLPNIKIVEIPGLVADYAKTNKIDFLIRSLRSSADFDNEMQLSCSNKKLCATDTLFLIGNPHFSHISSSLIHEIALGGHRLHEFVPEVIEDAVWTRITSKIEIR